MSVVDAFQAARTEQINNQEVKFARLILETDLANLCSQVTSERKDKAKALVKEAPIPNLELYAILQDIDDRTISIPGLLDKAGDPLWAIKIVKHSLVKAGNSPEMIAMVMDFVDAISMVNLAQELVLSRRPKDQAKEDKEKDKEAAKKEGKAGKAAPLSPKVAELPKGYGDAPSPSSNESKS